jgi:ubiquinone/menaquinone biosynthesis C-methylase UbiE
MPSELPDMANIYFQIKDKCRKGLLKYLSEAFMFVPKIQDPKILDIGCGTGVPTLWLANNYGGTITAIDADEQPINWLQEKIKEENLETRITALNISFFEFTSKPCNFDIILAEGFLNVVGFEQGFPKAMELLENHGYFVIHDEYKDNERKCCFMGTQPCELIGSLYLDENAWWDCYYRQLATEINEFKDEQTKALFKTDLKEIEYYKVDPTSFRSIYYVVKKYK